VGFADGENLFEVMLAVDELEFSPLVDVERPEGHVAGEPAGCAEDLFCLSTELIEMCQMFGRSVGEFFSAELAVCDRRRNQRRGFASMREVAEMDESVLGHMLWDAGLCAGGGSLGEARVQGHLGAGVAEQKVFHDLLNGPFVRARRWLELGLGGVESVEGEGDLALKTVEGGVHKQDHVTPVRGVAASVLCGSERCLVEARLLEFVQCFAGFLCFFTVGVKFEIGLELGDCFVFLLHLFRDLGEGVVSS